jgi:hypothetical protein
MEEASKNSKESSHSAHANGMNELTVGNMCHNVIINLQGGA